MIAAPLTELRHVKKLKRLAISENNRIGSIQFLRELPNLYFVDIQANLSEADDRLIKKINQTALADWKKRRAAELKLEKNNHRHGP